MRTISINSENLQLWFPPQNALHDIRIRNLSNNNIIGRAASQCLLIRLVSEVSVPVLLNKFISLNIRKRQTDIYLSDTQEHFKAKLSLQPSSAAGIQFDLEIEAPLPLWIVEWKISGLELERVLLPALGGQMITKKMPAGTTLSYKYPFWLNAQFIIGCTASGGMMLRTMDTAPDLKLVRVNRDPAGFNLTLGFEAPAPLHSKKLKARWFLECFGGNWREAVDQYRIWMERTFNLVPWQHHAHLPDWAKYINFILEIWGASRDRELPYHTFAQMRERLTSMSRLHDPKRTLVYLPGFAEKGIDAHAPDYNPSPQCGGEKEFQNLIRTAHRLGYRVMVHTNVLALTFSHPLYRKFKKYQVVDVFDRPQGWALDIDGDWLTEPYFAYINPGFPAWGNLMKDILGKLIKAYNIDAVFLDQTLLAFNVSKGPNFIAGMREHVHRLQRAFPQILFAGEGLHEQIVERMPMAQIHGLDSIKEIHGMEGTSSWRKIHPVSVYLFDKYTRFTAHLLTKHPQHPLFKFQENAYRQLKVIPALALYNAQQKMDLPQVREMLARAQKI